ncbi:MAG: Dps family protein [Saprospiraceae bacterium]
MNYLGLKQEDVQDTVEKLNHLLANYHVYYQNLRNFHWNVNGQVFFELHEQFEGLYNDAKLKIDEIAERILTLRHHPMSRLSEYLEEASVKEYPIFVTPTKMVDATLECHKVLIKDMREVIENAGNAADEGTIDMIGGFLGDLEKKSWMLDAWRAAKLEPVLS